jgi:hypothetical protein
MINKILFVGSLNRFNSPYQNWYLTLKQLCRKIVTFEMHWTTIKYGQDKMNALFLDFVAKEKPDFIFFVGGEEELYFETFFKIKKVSPNTRLINPFSDDDARFESFSRYFSLFFDIILVEKPEWLPAYKKDKLNHIIGFEGINTDFYKPLNLEKKYDVTLIGRDLGPKSLR